MTPEEQAQHGLKLIKQAIVRLVSQCEEGLANSDIARKLGLQSSFEGQQKNYLSWSILGLLIAEGTIRYEKCNGRRLYFATDCLEDQEG